jgi:pentapeptide MXKDX repeat protein
MIMKTFAKTFGVLVVSAGLGLGALPSHAQDAMKTDAMKSGAVQKDSMSKVAMSKDSMKKDHMKTDAMKQDSPKKDAMEKTDRSRRRPTQASARALLGRAPIRRGA